jgi:predicted nucleic acid-binding protein
MIVVSDASPLNYLVLIRQADLLQKLYTQVVIPPAVYHELQQKGTPLPVREWIEHPPKWLTIHRAAVPADPELSRLDPGEREAIRLAESLPADAILMDERDGRRIAARRHFTVIGTLRVLAVAAEAGFIDLPTALRQLETTTFRASARLLKIFLDRDAERKGDPSRR